MSSVLSARDLRVHAGPELLVGPLDLTVGAGERVGLVGRSGAGKSLTAAAVLDLLPPGLRRTGEVVVPTASGALFQESALALDPLVRVGRQLALPLGGVPRRERAAAVRSLAERLGLDDTALRAWPLDLSGGQRQRAAMALALVRRPALLVADEPTAALDAVTQRSVLATLREALEGTALLMISHDLALVSQLCDRVLVLVDGLVVDHGPVERLFAEPGHEETRRLVEAAAELGVTA